MKCIFCNLGKNEILKEYNFWRITLHQSQYYPGRCRIILKRHVEDLTEITFDEREELFEILIKLKKVLVNIFNVDLFNYTCAGNLCPHLHIHIIPRYNHEVEFDGFVFKDELWGKNHSFYPKDFKLENSITNKIKERIKEKL